MVGRLRAVGISDVHGRVAALEKVLVKERPVDLVLFAGDVAPYGLTARVEALLEKMAETAEKYGVKKLVAVPGNIDPVEAYERVRYPTFVNLHGRAMTYMGIAFIGFGGSTPTPFGTLTEFSEDEICVGLQRAHALLSKSETISGVVMLVHVPPYNTKCDKAFVGENIGSRCVRKMLAELDAKLVVSGHVHESRCIDVVDGALVVNPGPLARGYYSVIELGDEIRAELRSL